MTGSVRTPIGEIRCIDLIPGESVQEHFIKASLDGIPVVALIDNEVILRKDWSKELQATNKLSFVILPLGGGGGGRKLLTVVAMIAIAVGAFYLGGVGAAALGLAKGTAGFAAASGAISAGVSVIGSMIVSAILPPTISKNNLQDITSSPTYSLSAQGNSARLLQTIPKLYGKHIIYPDFASTPYLDFQGNDQYLYQLFSLGLGEYQVHEIKIEDAVLWNENTGLSSIFSDVAIQIAAPGERITLFPAAVETRQEVSGQELIGYDLRFKGRLINGVLSIATEYNSNNTPFNYFNVGEQLYFYIENTTTSNDNVSGGRPGAILPEPPIKAGSVYGTATVTEKISNTQLRLNNTTTFNSGRVEAVFVSMIRWYGPFQVSEPGNRTKVIQLDFSYPSGMINISYHKTRPFSNSVKLQIQVRKINDLGQPIGDWIEFIRIHTYQTYTPQRLTEVLNLADEARYEVRVRRDSHKTFEGKLPDNDYNLWGGYENTSQCIDTVQWSALRSYIVDDYVFSDVTTLAVKIKANSQLSENNSRRFNVVQTAKLPIYTGTSWTAPTATQNPAWALADVLRNSRYGADLPDSRIDLISLKQLADLWDQRGDKFNAVIDSKSSVFETLATIAKVGRAQPLIIGGVVSFMRDQQNSITRAFLTPKNILKDSLNVDYILNSEDSPDSIIVEFTDERTWQVNEVLCSLGSSSKIARIQIFGITNRTQAWREGMYQVANNIYRRVFANCDIEMEGRMLIRGDSVMIAHDMPKWGRPAEILEWNPSTRRVTVSEPVAGTRAILSDIYGRAYGHIEIENISSDGYSFNFNASSYNSVVNTQGPIPIFIEDQREPTRITVGTSTDYVKKFKVLGCTPRDINKISLELMIDDSRVYTADIGTPPEENTSNILSGVSTSPAVTGFTYRIDPDYFASNTLKMQISWNTSPGSLSYLLQISRGGGYWQSIYEGKDNYFVLYETVGVISLRVSALGLFRGAWSYINSIELDAPGSAPGIVYDLEADLNTTTGTISIRWGLAPRASSYIVKLYVESTLGNYNTLKIQKEVTSTSSDVTEQEISAVGGIWENIMISVSAKNTAGNSADSSVLLENLTLDSPDNLSILNSFSGREISASWNHVVYAFSYTVQLFLGEALLEQYLVYAPYISIGESENTHHRELTLKVRSNSSTITSSFSSVAVEDLAPSAPTGVVLTSPAAGQVLLEWDESSATDFKQYVVYHSYTSTVDIVPENVVYTGIDPEALITGLTTGVDSYFVLTTHDKFQGNSGYNYTSTFDIEVS